MLAVMNSMLVMGLLMFAALPATSNYKLNSYGFGSGGSAGSQTATYSLEGTTGELTGQTGATANNSSKPGFIETQQANVPTLAALDNNGGLFYNKLHFVLNEQGNPTDAKYLISVSGDNFVDDIKYLQSDGTLSTVLSTAQYRSFDEWGSGTGSLIIGLEDNTPYNVRAKATQGSFSESAFGPALTQLTAAASITFNLSTSAQASAPFNVNMGTLFTGIVNTSPDTINTQFSSNAGSGVNVFIKSKNSGLLSGSTGGKINAVSTDLDSVSQGFGAQSTSTTQTSGGPASAASLFNGNANNVGSITTVLQSIFNSSSPISGGEGKLLLKAKAAQGDIAASDYQEVITLTASGNF